MGVRNLVGIRLLYRPARILAESIPVPEFIDPVFAKTGSINLVGLLKIKKYRLWICFGADPDPNIFAKMPNNKSIIFSTMLPQNCHGAPMMV